MTLTLSVKVASPRNDFSPLKAHLAFRHVNDRKRRRAWCLIRYSNCVTFSSFFSFRVVSNEIMTQISDCFFHSTVVKRTAREKKTFIISSMTSTSPWKFTAKIREKKSRIAKHTRRKIKSRLPLICEKLLAPHKISARRFSFCFVPLNCSIRHTIDVWLATLTLKFIFFRSR